MDKRGEPRDEHLIVAEICVVLGGRERVAEAMRVNKTTIDKACLPLPKGGRPLTRHNLERLLEVAMGEERTEPFRRELLSRIYGQYGFIPAGKAELADLEIRVQEIKNGNGYAPRVISCPECGGQDYFRKTENGITIEVCRTCLGRGIGES